MNYVQYSEDQAMQRVVESLISAFPGVPERQVRACVEGVRAPFEKARVRTYLSILVARQARALLTESLATGEVGSAVPTCDSGTREFAPASAIPAPIG